MAEEISLWNTDGKSIRGSYEVTNGAITVTSEDGLSKTVDIDESMLSAETLAKMLLLQMHRCEDAGP